MYLVIDLEATCWNDGSKKPNETIEIGCALVTMDLKILSTFTTIVRPKLNPALSSFCKELTGITQDMVDGAQIFPDAISSFCNSVKEITDKPVQDHVFCSWGHYDKHQMERDCELHSIEYPFGRHVSVKHEFARRRHEKPCGVVNMLKKLGMTFEGNPHRGIDDARNIARILISELRSAGTV